jgi:hypothetical protein
MPVARCRLRAPGATDEAKELPSTRALDELFGDAVQQDAAGPAVALVAGDQNLVALPASLGAAARLAEERTDQLHVPIAAPRYTAITTRRRRDNVGVGDPDSPGEIPSFPALSSYGEPAVRRASTLRAPRAQTRPPPGREYPALRDGGSGRTR